MISNICARNAVTEHHCATPASVVALNQHQGLGRGWTGAGPSGNVVPVPRNIQRLPDVHCTAGDWFKETGMNLRGTWGRPMAHCFDPIHCVDEIHWLVRESRV